MAWFHLLLAILFEVSGTTSMKLSRGFTKLTPTIAIFIFYGLSVVFLTFAIRRIDISVAYAVWCGLGMALVAGVGVFWFSEPMTALKIASLVLIIVGIVGLNVGGGTGGG